MSHSKLKFHAGLNVSDVAKSTAFYADLLQTNPVKTRDDYSKFETDEIVLSIIQTTNAIDPNFGHFGLRVNEASELASRFEQLKGLGYQLLEENKVECCYALQDKFWVSDPDGYRWEIYHFLEDTGNLKSNEAPQEEAACCGPTCC